MNVSKPTRIALYKNLGKLFYAIALADRRIEEDEFNSMKKSVSSFMPTLDIVNSNVEDNFEYHIISIFNMLYINDYLAQVCFDDFIDFKRKNEKLFNKSLKHAILKIANTIASSFARQNKSELIMIAKLNIEFNK